VLQRILWYKKSSRAATVGERTSTMPLSLPSPWARVLLFIFCAVISVIVAAQFLAVIGGAFSTVWGANSTFTTAHLVSSLNYKQELINTIVFALITAAITALFGAVIAFFVQRTQLPLRKTVDSLVMIPAAMPGSLIGLAFVLAFNTRTIHLTGTRIIIVLVMLVCDLPAGYRILTATIMAIRTTLDDASRSLGASRMRLFFTIICPLISRGIVSSFVFTFVRASGTLSAVIFLISFKTKLTSVIILNLASQGDWSASAALAFILTVIIFFALGVLRLAGGKQFFKEILHRV
jgi:iron(III) transport system permease protein